MSNNKKEELTPELRAKRKSAIWKLVLLISVTAVIFGFYRYMLTTRFFVYVLAAYLTTLTVLVLVYIIYNRGMSRKNVTPDMLPDSWDYSQKEEYIENGKKRLKKSEWMLMPILGFVFTIAFELLELYVLPYLSALLGE